MDVDGEVKIVFRDVEDDDDDDDDIDVVMESGQTASAAILRGMFDDPCLCDVALYGTPTPGVNSSSLVPIRAHKAVLACASEHLRSLFTSAGFVDSRQPEYKFDNITHDTLQSIVKFIYTNKLEMSYGDVFERVKDILVAANYLLTKDLPDSCEAFLADTDRLNLEDCVMLWCFARKYTLVKLLTATVTYIGENLLLVSEQHDFLELALDDCKNLLSSEEVKASDDDRRCRAALAWLNYNDVHRAVHVEEILKLVPINSSAVSPSTIIRACENRSMSCEALHGAVLAKLKKMSSDEYDLSPSLPVGAVRDAWYFVGAGENNDQFLQYNIHTRRWTTFPALPWKRSADACIIGDRIVVMGNRKGGGPTADIDEYDFSAGSWTESTVKLSEARESFAMCADKQNVYAFGGFVDDDEVFFGEQEFDLAESYQTHNASMTQLPDMKFIRYGATATFYGNQNVIFVAGGNATYWTPDGLSIERFNISKQAWSSVGRLQTDRYYHSATLVADDLYIAGGRDDDSNATDVVEVFNVRSGQSRTSQALTEAREGCKAATLGANLVCVIGGCDNDHKELKTVETMDIREDKWTVGVIVPDMPVESSYFGFACV